MKALKPLILSLALASPAMALEDVVRGLRIIVRTALSDAASPAGANAAAGATH